MHDHKSTDRRRGSLTLIQRFLQDRRGSLYTFAAVIALPLTGFLGISADAARAYLVKARLSTSVDAAALAGGKVAFTNNYGADISKYFNSNFPPQFLGATVTGPTYSKTSVAGQGTLIKVSATAVVPTAFMHLFGFDTVTVSAESEVTRQNSAMDVVLSIDMSGSMDSWNGGKKKIDAARDAAKSLVDILYGDDETNEHLKIGLVPWNGNVNVMLDTTNASPLAGYIPSKTKKKFVSSFKNPNTGDWQNYVWEITNSPVLFLDQPGPSWKGCVYARYLNDYDTTNDADGDLGYVDDKGWKGWEPRIKLLSSDDDDDDKGKGKGKGKKKGKKKDEDEETSCKNCTPCLNHGITPLNQSKALIKNAIGKLKNPEGNTDIPQGLSWAWRVLMNTAPFTEGTADDPNKPLVRAIVLLTDGANCAATGDGYKSVWGGCYWYSTQKMDERAILIADKIKKQGILIYTIQFGFNDQDAASALKKIASGTGSPYYQYAPNASTLKAVFETIGTSLSDLRISK